MPAFIPVPNAVRSSLIYLMDSQVCVNTLTFRKATEPSVSDMAALNTALHTWYTASFKPSLGPQCALSAINTIGLWSASAPGALLSIAPVEPGTAGTNALNANVAWCASLRTALRGRNYRGRIYVPAVYGGGMSTQNTVLVGYVTAVVNALAQLLTPANVASFIWCVASRYLNKLPRVTGITTDLTAVTGDLTTDSQRRRLPGRGA